MDVQTAVSVSMLSVARARAAAAFNEIRHQGAGDPLEAVLEACEVPRGAWPAMVAEARERADRALREAGPAGAEPVSIFDCRYPPLLG